MRENHKFIAEELEVNKRFSHLSKTEETWSLEKERGYQKKKLLDEYLKPLMEVACH